MSTVIRAPEPPKSKPRKWCYDCPIEGERSNGLVLKHKYAVNTIIKCDDCGCFWIIRRGDGAYNYIKLLRWYHRAGWGLDRQEA